MVFRTNKANRLASDMIPKPPTWMSIRITPCPNGVQKVAVSTVIRPVTQTEDTAVKKAVVTRSSTSPVREMGSIKIPAPMMITARNANGTERTGCSKDTFRRSPSRPSVCKSGLRRTTERWAVDSLSGARVIKHAPKDVSTLDPFPGRPSAYNPCRN